MRICHWVALAACAISLCAVARPSAAPRAQDAAPAASPVVELIRHVPLSAPTADLWAHKDTVYVGTWYGAQEGVRLIDIADPTQPRRLGNLPHRHETSYEDVMVIEARTRAFQGDLLREDGLPLLLGCRQRHRKPPANEGAGNLPVHGRGGTRPWRERTPVWE